MNRKSFLKKLGIGAVAVVIAPKVLIATQKPMVTTGGVIPYLAGQGLKQALWIPKPRNMKISEAEFRELCIKYSRYYNEAWLKMEKSIENHRKNQFYTKII